jgi:hypothetical protein
MARRHGALAEEAASLDDGVRALTLYDLLVPYADRVATSYSEACTGSVSRYLGLLASTASRFDDAARHFEDAIAMNERIGARPWLAATEEDYARMLLELEAPSGSVTARALLDRAAATYRELGMESAVARASATRLSDEGRGSDTG